MISPRDQLSLIKHPPAPGAGWVEHRLDTDNDGSACGSRTPAHGRECTDSHAATGGVFGTTAAHPRKYTSIDYAQTLDDHGVLASVGSVGDAYDNALAESFVDSFKTELIADRVWRTRSQLELAVVEYVGWFNNARLHESLGDIPPAEYEQRHAARPAVAASLGSPYGLAP